MTFATRSRIWLPAAAMGLVVALLTALAGHFLLQAGLRHSAPILQEATRTGAGAVGEAVAGQFARALEFGIPLERLGGVDAYLRRIADGSPHVDGFALLDEGGRIIASTAPDVRGETFEIVAGGARAALVVAAVSPLFEDAMRRIWISLGLAALLAGLVAGALTAGYLGLSWQPARARLLRAVDRAADGSFDVIAAREPSGPFFEASQALARSVERVETARRKLAEAVSTIRAIDFDGSLGRRVDVILGPLEGRYALPDRSGDEAHRAEGAPAGGAIWRVAVVAGLYAASLPFVGNFAIDRGVANLPAAWVAVAPLAAELLAMLAGVLAGRAVPGRGGSSLALALVLLGVSTGATFWCRDYALFVLLRCGGGLAAGLALSTMLANAPVLARPRVLSLALVFSALLVAPLLSGLLAEAIGRRATFLVLGILALVLAPFVAGTGGPVPGERAAAPARGFDWATALTVFPVAAFVLVLLPTGVGYDNYLVGTGAAAVLGLAALATPRLPEAATGAALLVAALVLHLAPGGPVVAVYAAGAALGVALGGAVANARGRPGAIAAAIAAGTGLGLAMAGAAGQFMFAPAIAMAAAGLMAMALPLLRRPGRNERRG